LNFVAQLAFQSLLELGAQEELLDCVELRVRLALRHIRKEVERDTDPENEF
jgi:hypothetical protein